MPKIVFKIGKNGVIESEGQDFKGSACLEKTEKYLQGLGTVQKQEFKDEFYAGEEAGVTISRG